nr:MAG TPA: hypothetical protein [Caudoviricetes sp.]
MEKYIFFFKSIELKLYDLFFWIFFFGLRLRKV